MNHWTTHSLGVKSITFPLPEKLKSSDEELSELSIKKHNHAALLLISMNEEQPALWREWKPGVHCLRYYPTWTTGILSLSFLITSVHKHMQGKCYYCPTVSSFFFFFPRMKSCAGTKSCAKPSYKLLHINTVTVDYYGRQSDTLHVRLDNPNIWDCTLLHRELNNQNILQFHYQDIFLTVSKITINYYYYYLLLLITPGSMALPAPHLKPWF